MISSTALYKLTPLKLVIISGIIIVILGLQIVPNSLISKHVTTPPSLTGVNSTSNVKPHTSLVFFLRMYGHYYTNNLKVFAKNLREGDYLLIRGNPSEATTVIQKVVQSRSLFGSGVHVNSAIFYYSIDDIVKTVPKLPTGIDFIVYDYEKGDNYSPEFTTNESKSIQYFDQAKSAILQYDKNTGGNAKLLVTMPYGELHSANWDWKRAAKHMDVIDMQLQAFLKNHQLMESYILNTYDATYAKTLIFVQVSLAQVRGTIQDNVDTIHAIKSSKVDAFLVWYQSNQTSDLEQFFSAMQ